MALGVANRSSTTVFACNEMRRVLWHVSISLRIAAQWLWLVLFGMVNVSVRFGALTMPCIAARNGRWDCAHCGTFSSAMVVQVGLVGYLFSRLWRCKNLLIC